MKTEKLYNINYFLDENIVEKNKQWAHDTYIETKRNIPKQKSRKKMCVIVFISILTVYLFYAGLCLNKPEILGTVWTGMFMPISILSLFLVATCLFLVSYFDGELYDAKMITEKGCWDTCSLFAECIDERNIVDADVLDISGNIYLSLYWKNNISDMDEVKKNIAFGGFKVVENNNIDNSYFDLHSMIYYKKNN